METERIALSQRERDRLRVLHEVQQKQITQIAAARHPNLASYPRSRRCRSSDGCLARHMYKAGQLPTSFSRTIPVQGYR
jgi:hypothetical protein